MTNRHENEVLRFGPLLTDEGKCTIIIYFTEGGEKTASAVMDIDVGKLQDLLAVLSIFL